MNWLAYFEHNRSNRAVIPWERGVAVEPQLSSALIHSLQRFQIGEQGDGIHLRRNAKATNDSDYLAAIDLFIQEEQEHSRLLARLIQAMNGQLLKWHWSDLSFVILRRLLGLRLELMVLLIAEMIAKNYYRILYEENKEPVLRAVFAQILRDEVGHVEFHSYYLHQSFVHWPLVIRFLIHLSWQIVFRVTVVVVWYDHSKLLRMLNISFGRFWRDCDLIFNEVAAQIFYFLRMTNNLKAEIELI
jgi:hypothetical protein